MVKMPKVVAEKVRQFGQCAGQGPGIDHTTAISKEEFSSSGISVVKSKTIMKNQKMIQRLIFYLR